MLTLVCQDFFISDVGKHFYKKAMESLLKKYGVRHRVLHYHPQASGQVELANREVRTILTKEVNIIRKDWPYRNVEALWIMYVPI